MTIKSLSIVAAAALVLLAGTAQAQNRFANGGFEIGQTTVPGNPDPVPNVDPSKAQGWIPSAQGYDRSADAHSGSFSALVHQLSSDNAGVMLQNSKATGGMPNVTPGETLTLSFWAKASVTEALDFYTLGYSLRYLNDNGDILSNTGFVPIKTLINNTTWSLITGSPTVVPDNATAAFLEFSAAGGGRLGAFNVDDVALVPEPSTYAMLLAGLGFVGFMARRRRAA